MQSMTPWKSALLRNSLGFSGRFVTHEQFTSFSNASLREIQKLEKPYAWSVGSRPSSRARATAWVRLLTSSLP